METVKYETGGENNVIVEIPRHLVINPDNEPDYDPPISKEAGEFFAKALLEQTPAPARRMTDQRQGIHYMLDKMKREGFQAYLDARSRRPQPWPVMFVVGCDGVHFWPEGWWD